MSSILIWVIIVAVCSFTIGLSLSMPKEGYVVETSREVDAAYIDLAPSRKVKSVAWSQPVVVDCRENMGKVEAVLDFDDEGRLVGIEFIGLCTSSTLISDDGVNTQIGNNETNLARAACPPHVNYDG